MATDILAPSISSLDASAEDSDEDYREYIKIVQLRNAIRDGLHPRFRPASHSGVTPRSTPQAPVVPPTSPRDLQPRKPTTVPVSRVTAARINDILLSKSDVLVKAEIQLKRQRIEKDIQKNLKLYGHKKKWSLTDSMEEIDLEDTDDEVLNFELIMKEAGVRRKPIVRSEEAALIEPAVSVPSGAIHRRENGTDPGEPIPKRFRNTQDEQAPSTSPELLIRPGPPRNAGEQDTVSAEALSPRCSVIDVSLASLRNLEPPTSPPTEKAIQLQPIPPLTSDLRLRARGPAPVQERPYSPPARPQYSATSQLRSPAAPQPIRPANMARVESQDARAITEAEGDDTLYPRYSGDAQRTLHRDRSSPRPHIKQEPASPLLRDLALRFRSPDTSQRPPSAVPYGGRPRYEYPPLPPPPPPHGYYMHSHPPPLVHPFDPYAYSIPPPLPLAEYARKPYPPVFAPAVASEYYPVRPAYDDYDRRFAPLPAIPVRQPSRMTRRSPSPRLQRRASRSASPPAERSRAVSRPVSRVEYRPPSRMSAAKALSPPPAGYYGRTLPPSPLTPRGAELYHEQHGHYYRSPRAGAPYYADPYYRHPRYGEYPPRVESVHLRYGEYPQRIEGVIPARETDHRNYRSRDYSYPIERDSVPPPPLSTYSPHDHARAARAEFRENAEYRPDYLGRASIRPEERDRGGEYAGLASARPGAGGHPPSRYSSVVPEANRAYAERESASMRPPSVRPDIGNGRHAGERIPLVGYMDPGSMQPPAIPYGGIEHGEGRSRGKY